jgi:tripartite-type tricarboxylate transporter receptor subunit TctC
MNNLQRSLVTSIFVAVSLTSQAQNYPNKPITLVVPNPPGGFVDASACFVSDALTKVMGQVVVVNNKSGGSGNTDYGQVTELSSQIKQAMELSETKTRAEAAGVEVRYQSPDT